MKIEDDDLLVPVAIFSIVNLVQVLIALLWNMPTVTIIPGILILVFDLIDMKIKKRFFKYILEVICIFLCFFASFKLFSNNQYIDLVYYVVISVILFLNIIVRIYEVKKEKENEFR